MTTQARSFRKTLGPETACGSSQQRVFHSRTDCLEAMKLISSQGGSLMMRPRPTRSARRCPLVDDKHEEAKWAGWVHGMLNELVGRNNSACRVGMLESPQPEVDVDSVGVTRGEWTRARCF